MTDYVIAIVSVLSFLMAAAGVLGSWRASKNTGALNLYRETAQAWEGKSKAQDAEMDDLKGEIGQLRDQMHLKDQQLAEQAGQIQVLRDTVTGKASWDILEHRIAEALQLAGDTRTEVRSLRDSFSDNHKQVLAALAGRSTP